ncbi:MAG: hypothetical protein IKB97_06040 [Bacteroidaceae bacterium]|nr:hypothetical protein [Fibrobacter sp.]MBR2863100.1 hypothetical protein [Bacteroidaceae bacterium]MBR6317202.1 hypothetical protein [Fibrobacter sp.]
MEEEYLDIHISNNSMVSLADLADSMNAMASEFHDFCNSHECNCNAELKVKEIRKGSIELLLVSSVPMLVPLCPLAPLTPLGSTPYQEGVKAGMRRAQSN